MAVGVATEVGSVASVARTVAVAVGCGDGVGVGVDDASSGVGVGCDITAVAVGCDEVTVGVGAMVAALLSSRASAGVASRTGSGTSGPPSLVPPPQATSANNVSTAADINAVRRALMSEPP